MKCYFDDWKEKSKGLSISRTLLWEYDMSKFDWEKMKRVVIERVVERGTIEDIYAMISLYGGIPNVREEIKKLPHLTDKGMAFVSAIFSIKKESLLSYKRKQEREKYLNPLKT